MVSSLTNNPYFYSKRLAEEAAWKIWKEHKNEIDLVVINPLLVFGPMKSPNLNSSLKNLIPFLMGQNKVVPPTGVGIVDVRDVAVAHVDIGLELPNVVGRRLICCGENSSWKRITDILKMYFPDYPVSTTSQDPNITFTTDNLALKEFGFTKYHTLEDTLRDTVESLIKFNAVPDLCKKMIH